MKDRARQRLFDLDPPPPPLVWPWFLALALALLAAWLMNGGPC